MQPQRTLLFLHKPQICSHLARREEPAAVIVAASMAAGMHESGSVSAWWQHASAHACSVGACRLSRRMQARSAHIGIVASAHVGSIDACRQGLLGACIAGFCPGGTCGILMQGMTQRNHGPTVEHRHHPMRPHLSARTDDTVQHGPTSQSLMLSL